MVVVIIGVADRTTTLVNVLVWTQMIIVRRVNAVVAVTNVVNVHVRSDVALADLVQDGPGSLGVDGRDLSHDLTVVVVGIVVVLACSGLLLRWANLLSTCSFRTVSMIPVLTLIRLVRRATALSCLIALEAVLLVVVYSASPEHFR
jgi:hypothetical protein